MTCTRTRMRIFRSATRHYEQFRRTTRCNFDACMKSALRKLWAEVCSHDQGLEEMQPVSRRVIPLRPLDPCTWRPYLTSKRREPITQWCGVILLWNGVLPKPPLNPQGLCIFSLHKKCYSHPGLFTTQLIALPTSSQTKPLCMYTICIILHITRTVMTPLKADSLKAWVFSRALLYHMPLLPHCYALLHSLHKRRQYYVQILSL
jgi:hypothetical protein